MSAALDIYTGETSPDMSDIDMSHEAMEPPALSDAYRPSVPADGWLERRTHAWGGSEMGPLLVAYGLAPMTADLPVWVIEQSEPYQRLGIPKLLAWKSGLRPRTKGDQRSKRIGSDREHELYLRYRAGAAKFRVNPRSMRYANSIPRQFLPFVDRRCHRLAVTPDAWAKAHDNELAMIELKCTFKPVIGPRAPWHYRVQLQAEIGACDARYGLLVMGEQWINDPATPDKPKPPDGPIRVFAFARDDAMIQLIRTVATEAWEVVEQLRNLALEVDALGNAQTAAARRTRKAAATKCAEVWRASLERMRAFRDPTREYLDDVLGELDGLDEILARQSA